MFTHDWPQDLPGSKEFLLKKRPNLKEAIEKNELTSPMHKLLLQKLKPKHWFANAMMLYFQTNCDHPDKSGDTTIETTRFLGLNKCAPKRKYLELINVPSDEFNIDGLEYDLEWLAILRMTSQWISNQKEPFVLPPQPWAVVEFDIESEKKKIEESFGDNLKIPKNFTVDLPFERTDDEPTTLKDIDPGRRKNYANRQTTEFCRRLGVKDPMQSMLDLLDFKVANPDEIDISDSDSVVDWSDTLVMDPPACNGYREHKDSSENQPAFRDLPRGFNSVLNDPNNNDDDQTPAAEYHIDLLPDLPDLEP